MLIFDIGWIGVLLFEKIYNKKSAAFISLDVAFATLLSFSLLNG